MPILTNFTLNIKPDHVIQAQGANPDEIRARRPSIIKLAEWSIDEGMPLIEPVVLYQRFAKRSVHHERLELLETGTDDSTKKTSKTNCSLSGPLIAKHLSSADEIVVLICTVGSTLEHIASELMNTDPLHGWALDSFGSAAVEFIANEVCNYFEEIAWSNSAKTSIPLSPGMIGWKVDTGQVEIFSLLNAGSIGVKLEDSYMMLPRKTLSMALGMGKNIEITGKTCDYCSMNATCKYKSHYDPQQMIDNE